MDYFKVNYDNLKKLPCLHYFWLIYLVMVLFCLIIIMSSYFSVSKRFHTVGIYHDGLLSIELNSQLSDILKDNNILSFNNEKYVYKIQSFNDYEIIEDNIYEHIDLVIDGGYDNEIGEVIIYYDTQKIIKYILDLFK